MNLGPGCFPVLDPDLTQENKARRSSFQSLRLSGQALEVLPGRLHPPTFPRESLPCECGRGGCSEPRLSGCSLLYFPCWLIRSFCPGCWPPFHLALPLPLNVPGSLISRCKSQASNPSGFGWKDHLPGKALLDASIPSYTHPLFSFCLLEHLLGDILGMGPSASSLFGQMCKASPAGRTAP